tara:strand:- start:26 stop:439 length:414 start_codon:yes stop_codon:yes gene_type:complete
MKVSRIKIVKRKYFTSPKGKVLKYISKKENYFKGFGEIYFNKINHKKTKGWILHKKNTCIFYCIVGDARFHFVDSFKKEKKITLNDKSHKIIIVPPKIWFSIYSKAKHSIIGNLINFSHKDNEVLKSQKIKNYSIKN